MPPKPHHRKFAGNEGGVVRRPALADQFLPVGVLAAMMMAALTVEGQENGASAGTRRARLLSPEILQAVIEKLPKYTSPAPAKAAPEPSSADGKDSHGVLHLPKVTVKERPPAHPSEFEWLTPKGRLDLALRTHPGLRLGNFFGMNNGIALAIQAEERKVAEKADLTDAVRRSTPAKSAESKRLLRMIDDAFRRPNDDWAAWGGPMK